MEGPVAEHTVGRCARAMPFVVGRKARAPEGSTAVFEVTGGAARRLAIKVTKKRAHVLTDEFHDLNVRSPVN